MGEDVREALNGKSIFLKRFRDPEIPKGPDQDHRALSPSLASFEHQLDSSFKKKDDWEASPQLSLSCLPS
jgi:hypothetical protein